MAKRNSIFIVLATVALTVALTLSVGHAQSKLPGRRPPTANGIHGAPSAHPETAAAAHHEAPDGNEATLLGAAKWVAIIFVIFAVIVFFAFWQKSIGPGLVKRRKQIEGDLENARKELQVAQEALKRQNEQLAGAESRMNEMLAKARADGEKLAMNIRTAAQQEAQDAKTRATRDIESSKNAAIREVYEQTATISTNIAEQILRRNINADDQRELVRQSLEQLQTIK